MRLGGDDRQNGKTRSFEHTARSMSRPEGAHERPLAVHSENSRAKVQIVRETARMVSGERRALISVGAALLWFVRVSVPAGAVGFGPFWSAAVQRVSMCLSDPNNSSARSQWRVEGPASPKMS